MPSSHLPFSFGLFSVAFEATFCLLYFVYVSFACGCTSPCRFHGYVHALVLDNDNCESVAVIRVDEKYPQFKRTNTFTTKKANKMHSLFWLAKNRSHSMNIESGNLQTKHIQNDDRFPSDGLTFCRSTTTSTGVRNNRTHLN